MASSEAGMVRKSEEEEEEKRREERRGEERRKRGYGEERKSACNINMDRNADGLGLGLLENLTVNDPGSESYSDSSDHPNLFDLMLHLQHTPYYTGYLLFPYSTVFIRYLGNHPSRVSTTSISSESSGVNNPHNGVFLAKTPEC